MKCATENHGGEFLGLFEIISALALSSVALLGSLIELQTERVNDYFNTQART